MALIIFVSIYCFLIIILAFGFARLEELPVIKDPTFHFISVIIPVRNENIIPDFSGIEYPRDKWELIVVDDSDKTSQSSFATLRSSSAGKKAAITTGINSAKGEIIVTTDADCSVQPLWLNKINDAFQNSKIKMVIGGVRIEEGESFFSKLQALEFVSVAVTGAATLGLGFPTMCNGANLAYRKEAFIEVNGYAGNEKISSGDDEFLMNKIGAKHIAFMKSRESVLSTRASATVKEFVNQRLRWAGKWGTNKSVATKIFATVIYLFHLGFLPMLIGAIMGWTLYFFLVATKIFFEAILLIAGANFFGVKWRWIPFFVLQLIYSPYVVTVGLLSQVVVPKWKGRAVETKV